jgi:hypothetical protein
VPTVEILADVSGRVAGDHEVRHLVESVLTHLEGIAIDDYTFPEHAWQIAEIRADHRVNGLKFFDYQGYAGLKNPVGAA